MIHMRLKQIIIHKISSHPYFRTLIRYRVFIFVMRKYISSGARGKLLWGKTALQHRHFHFSVDTTHQRYVIWNFQTDYNHVYLDRPQI